MLLCQLKGRSERLNEKKRDRGGAADSVTCCGLQMWNRGDGLNETHRWAHAITENVRRRWVTVLILSHKQVFCYQGGNESKKCEREKKVW